MLASRFPNPDSRFSDFQISSFPDSDFQIARFPDPDFQIQISRFRCPDRSRFPDSVFQSQISRSRFPNPDFQISRFPDADFQIQISRSCWIKNYLLGAGKNLTSSEPIYFWSHFKGKLFICEHKHLNIWEP